MSNYEKDVLAWTVVFLFSATILVTMVWAAGWFLPIVAGMITSIFLFAWALNRVCNITDRPRKRRTAK